MQRLLDKQFEIKLRIKRKFLFIPYTRTILLQFKEARFIDTIEFLEIVKGDWKNIIKWLLKFIKEHTKTKLTKKDKQYIMMYADEIIPTIKETYLNGCFADYDGISGDEGEDGPMSAYLAILSEKLNIHPLELVSKYTVKQMELLTEGIIWNGNAQSKDGQKRNRLWLSKQKAKNRTKEEDNKIKDILLDLQK